MTTDRREAQPGVPGQDRHFPPAEPRLRAKAATEPQRPCGSPRSLNGEGSGKKQGWAEESPVWLWPWPGEGDPRKRHRKIALKHSDPPLKTVFTSLSS